MGVAAALILTVYIFSGTKVIAEYVNSLLSKEYIYSGSSLLAKTAGSTSTYHHVDHLSVRVTTDASGSILGQQVHYPFGEQWYPVPPQNSATKWQFTSYERDSESWNDYAMARYYINRFGRFSSPDLIAGAINNPQLLNRFAYVRNDPLNLIDPFGLQGCGANTCIEVNGSPDYFDTTNSVIGGWNYAAQFGGPGATPLEQILAGGRRGPGGDPPVNKRWAGTFDCNKTDKQVSDFLKNNFGSLASTTLMDGPVLNIVDFSSPNGISPGTGVDTNVTTLLFTGSGVESFNLPNARAHLTVASASRNNFVLQTDPQRSPLNGTLTFSVIPNANNQVTFSIQAQGNYTSFLSQLLSKAGKYLENGIWNNLINKVKEFCAKK